jgi:hypothetical protein
VYSIALGAIFLMLSNYLLLYILYSVSVEEEGGGYSTELMFSTDLITVTITASAYTNKS